MEKKKALGLCGQERAMCANVSSTRTLFVGGNGQAGLCILILGFIGQGHKTDNK